MPRRTLLSEIRKINEITRLIRADTENLGVNVALRALPSEEQISEFCRSAEDLKKVAGYMEELRKASVRLAAARESAGERPRAKKVRKKKPIKYTLNTTAMGLNARMVAGSFRPARFPNIR